ncbi:MAG: hypothetical protein IJK63_03160, partial [Oscillospiraceae bacterium]|nr:hypothetical protein [Oscillospiraceae bacterium]
LAEHPHQADDGGRAGVCAAVSEDRRPALSEMNQKAAASGETPAPLAHLYKFFFSFLSGCGIFLN